MFTFGLIFLRKIWTSLSSQLCVKLYPWFLLLRFFGLLSSSLLLFPQREDWIIWRLQVQSSLQVSNNTGILNTCTRLWLTESEQANPVVSIKDVVRSSVKVPEFDKHLKKARGHIGWNVVEITMKMKTIVWKTLMIKINKLCLRNLDNLYPWCSSRRKILTWNSPLRLICH